MSIKLGMGTVSVEDICNMIGCSAKYYGCDSITVTGGIETDSRKVGEGDIFIAIKGENFDGADFSSSAVLSGACCVISTRPPDKAEELGRPFAYIESADPCATLAELARKYKESKNIKTVAVTGSVGKTTTKEMVAAVLGKRFKVGKTIGNLNTDIGLSMSVLSFTPDVEVAVLEMGMSGFGEIEKLSLIAEPDYGIITNIGTSHIEYLKTRENIAKAKMEITAGMKEDGVLVLCGDEPLLKAASKDRANATFVSVYSSEGEYRAENIRYKDLKTTFDLMVGERKIADLCVPALGIHHVYGALFACAIADRFGLSDNEIRSGLLEFKNADMRQSIYDIGGITVIDASYNASPESMRASLAVLCELSSERKARKFALLGDMCELGSETRNEHEKLGVYAGKLGLDGLVTFGIASVCTAESAKASGMDAEKIISEINIAAPEKCAEKLAGVLKKGDILLVKASRAIAAEKIITYLKDYGEF